MYKCVENMYIYTCYTYTVFEHFSARGVLGFVRWVRYSKEEPYSYHD